MIWVTADPHYGHANIIKYCKRPFSSAQEMDEILIRNTNRLVMPSDTLKIVGDFCMSKNFDTIKYYRDRINCQNVHLILGNHDYLNEDEYKQIFQKVTHRDIFKFNGQQVVCDHYSGRIWYNSHRGAWLLWGHSHGAVNDYGLSFDVGVDNWDLCPLSMNQISDIMKVKKQHHLIKEDKEIIEDRTVVDDSKGIHKEDN